MAGSVHRTVIGTQTHLRGQIRIPYCSTPHQSVRGPLLLGKKCCGMTSPGDAWSVHHRTSSDAHMGRDSSHRGAPVATAFRRSPTLNSQPPDGVAVLTIRPATADDAAYVEPLLDPAPFDPANDSGYSAKLAFAYNVSWVVNILLLVSKAYVWWTSGSKAVLASLVDSFVDLISQLVIFVAEWRSRRMDPRFPVGQARLETIGVLACALIMALASVQVIQESVLSLLEGFVKGDLPVIDAGMVMYIVLGSATGLKFICYILCAALASKSDSMVALAEDHLNDIMSNVAAAVTAAIAVQVSTAWWADPAGAILISAYILWRWFDIAKNQVDKIVGRAAPESFIEQLTSIGEAHHENVDVDCIRAYHVGARFMVEMEIVMPITYTLKEVHDIALELQHKIEALDAVERAFVHVDYARRDQPEHRTERLLAGLPVLREESSFSA